MGNKSQLTSAPRFRQLLLASIAIVALGCKVDKVETEVEASNAETATVLCAEKSLWNSSGKPCVDQYVVLLYLHGDYGDVDFPSMMKKNATDFEELLRDTHLETFRYKNIDVCWLEPNDSEVERYRTESILNTPISLELNNATTVDSLSAFKSALDATMPDEKDFVLLIPDLRSYLPPNFNSRNDISGNWDQVPARAVLCAIFTQSSPTLSYFYSEVPSDGYCVMEITFPGQSPPRFLGAAAPDKTREAIWEQLKEMNRTANANIRKRKWAFAE